MPIRRLTTTTTTVDEIVDSVDNHSGTALPTQTVNQEIPAVDRGTSIDPYEAENVGVPETLSNNDGKNTTVGRTIADLIVVSKNDPRIMAVVLTVISFGIFIAKLDTQLSVFDNLKYGIITAIILNSIWFGIPAAGTFIEQTKKK